MSEKRKIYVFTVKAEARWTSTLANTKWQHETLSEAFLEVWKKVQFEDKSVLIFTSFMLPHREAIAQIIAENRELELVIIATSIGDKAHNKALRAILATNTHVVLMVKPTGGLIPEDYLAVVDSPPQLRGIDQLVSEGISPISEKTFNFKQWWKECKKLFE